VYLRRYSCLDSLLSTNAHKHTKRPKVASKTPVSSIKKMEYRIMYELARAFKTAHVGGNEEFW